MKLLISDANILIDMEVGEILGEMFRLEYDFAVPDVIFDQELNNKAKYIDLGLNKLELTAQSIAEVVRIKNDITGSSVSTNDVFALSLAKQEGCKLLTGDMALRRLSESEGVQVHGTIWVVEKMLQSGMIAIEQAETAYELMREDGSRLPWDDVEEQIKRHKN